MSDDIMLSEHFALSEFVASDTASAQGIDNTPTPEAMMGLEQLAPVMEKVRNILGGHPITITSGYRCPELNAAVGGAPDSAHLYGLACDFVCESSAYVVCCALEGHVVELGIDQLILESGGGEWTHLAIAGPAETARHECLQIDANGTNYGFAVPTALEGDTV
jgi:zinc D-Ala-D-Ala carboxypeptidase